ncbi:MAG: hypothetical protein ABIR15_04850 [Chitinophagaceae bacterium]
MALVLFLWKKSTAKKPVEIHLIRPSATFSNGEGKWKRLYLPDFDIVP